MYNTTVDFVAEEGLAHVPHGADVSCILLNQHVDFLSHPCSTECMRGLFCFLFEIYVFISFTWRDTRYAVPSNFNVLIGPKHLNRQGTSYTVWIGRLPNQAYNLKNDFPWRREINFSLRI